MAASRIETFRFGEEELRRFARDMLRQLGVPAAHAEVVSDCLVFANLRGVDSHGLELFPGYVQQLQEGGVNRTTPGAVASESGGCLLYDGQNGLGQVVAHQCAGHAVRLARAGGLGLVVARNSHHYGAAGFWTEQMARGGCIGISMSTAGANVPPWGGLSPRVGTNPIAMSVPGSGPGGWLLDMATSTVAKGKLANAADYQWETIPAAWGFRDTDGQPTTDRRKAEAGWPSPLGGYKGTGLAMMAEILCAGLSGGPMATEAPVHRNGLVPLRISQMFLAVEAGRFLPQEDFQERVRRLAAMMRFSPVAPGHEEVLVAGDPEWREEANRRRLGVPIPGPLWGRLTAIAKPLGVKEPARLG